MKVVLTGDLVHSRAYTPAKLSEILEVLQSTLAEIPDADFKLYRGDSFQCVMNDPLQGLQAALQLKTAVNRVEAPDTTELVDVRISIGIGTIDLARASILESNGTAFQYSGTTLDNLKGDYKRLAVTTSSESINGEFHTSLALLDSVMTKWSIASAEVVYYLLLGHTEKEIAKKIGVSQAAINARKKVAQWDAIKLLLERYKVVISNYVAHGS